MKNIVAIGEILIDLISTEESSFFSELGNFEPFLGGSPMNFAHYLNLLHENVQIIGTVGKDAFGDKAIQNIQENQLNGKAVVQTLSHNTSIIVLSKSKTTASFISYRDADMQITQNQIDSINFETLDLIHTTAFALSKEPAKSSILNAFTKANKVGKFVSIDFNYSNEIWANQREEAQDILQELAKMGAFIKVSSDDVSRLFGKAISPENFINEYIEMGARLVCYTAGSEGAYASDTLNEIHYYEARKIDVIDATGAGDSFWAGFISSYLKDNNIESALEQGSVIAEKKLQITGQLRSI